LRIGSKVKGDFGVGGGRVADRAGKEGAKEGLEEDERAGKGLVRGGGAEEMRKRG
jgi:hypothetical protein